MSKSNKQPTKLSLDRAIEAVTECGLVVAFRAEDDTTDTWMYRTPCNSAFVYGKVHDGRFGSTEVFLDDGSTCMFPTFGSYTLVPVLEWLHATKGHPIVLGYDAIWSSDERALFLALCKRYQDMLARSSDDSNLRRGFKQRTKCTAALIEAIFDANIG